MVSAQKQLDYRYQTNAAARAAALPARQPVVEQAPVTSARTRTSQSNARHDRAVVATTICTCGVALSMGILSLYGQICQTREANEQHRLLAELKIVRQKAEELTVRNAKFDTEGYVSEQARLRNYVRFGDADAVTVTAEGVKMPALATDMPSPERHLQESTTHGVAIR